MAEPATYNVDDLRRELGILYMECRVRAAREDQLKQVIIERDAEIMRLRNPGESPPKRVKGGSV